MTKTNLIQLEWLPKGIDAENMFINERLGDGFNDTTYLLDGFENIKDMKIDKAMRRTGHLANVLFIDTEAANMRQQRVDALVVAYWHDNDGVYWKDTYLEDTKTGECVAYRKRLS